MTHPDMKSNVRQKTTILIVDDGDAGEIGFAETSYVSSDEEQLNIFVVRKHGNSSAVSVLIRVFTSFVLPQGTERAESGTHYSFSEQTLRWEDGDTSDQSVSVDVKGNGGREDVVFGLEMVLVDGGATISPSATNTILTVKGVSGLTSAEIVGITVGVVVVVTVAALMFFRFYKTSKAKIKHMHSEVMTANRKKDELTRQNESLMQSLKEAQLTINKVVHEGGSLLEPYKLSYFDLVFGEKIGEGAFGTVFCAEHRGTAVAVKTVRATKVTEHVIHEVECFPSFFSLWPLDSIVVLTSLPFQLFPSVLGRG